MKHKEAGTLKVEIIKPLNESWSDIGNRMHALRKSLGHALNLTMRDFQPEAISEIASIRNSEKPDKSWRQKIETKLREHWNSELARDFDKSIAWYEKEQKKPKKHRKSLKEPNDRAYLPISECISAETVNVLTSRFSGDHLKDLIAGRSSIPSWKNTGVAFAARERACRIEGKANKARLTFPLWGMGKKATTFEVAPCGGGHIARWNQLVRDYPKREEIVALEQRVKNKELPEEERNKALEVLKEMEAIKLGKIGITYNKRKGKWYAFITWTMYKKDIVEANVKAAAANFGVNVFIQALCEDGTDWSDPGLDILVMRKRFGARRRSIQKSLRRLGMGSRGHGVKRLYLPITKLEDKESRWVETRIRVLASDIIKWCKVHNITDLYLEDLTGIREAFEQKTQGDAHEEVKRFIHSWPFYQTQQAIKREGEEHGVNIHVKNASFDSQRCPSCGHTCEENVSIIRGGGDYLIHNGKSYRSFESWTQFQCVQCGLKHKGDIVTCANHLIDVGYTHSLEKQQSKAKKAVKTSLKAINAKQTQKTV